MGVGVGVGLGGLLAAPAGKEEIAKEEFLQERALFASRLPLGCSGGSR